jgi:branched-chain amino acid transport system ATP-binding protein
MYQVKTTPTPQEETAPYRPLLLRAVGVTKRFGGIEALRGVSLEVPRHSIVSLIGPNGSGKTVFFNVVTGLTRHNGGEIWFDGHPIAGLAPDKITAMGIARTFQNIRLFGNMSILENVLVGQHTRTHENLLGILFHSQDVTKEERRLARRGMELLDFIGLAEVADGRANSLPYGEQRRLEIARALAANPQLLLLDEPTAGMNPSETDAIIRLISRLRDELGLAVLLVEHDMRVVMRISDRIAVLDRGEKISEGTPQEVRGDPRVVEAYLGRVTSDE